MVSNKWQKRHFTIEHLVLFGIWAGTIYWFEFPFPQWLKILIVISSATVVFLLGRYYHKRSATNYVKVFRTDLESAMHITQRVFEAGRIPFRKTPSQEGIRFEAYGKNVFLFLEDFPLNIQLDLDFETVESTKITLWGENAAARALAEEYCEVLDQAFATS